MQVDDFASLATWFERAQAEAMVELGVRAILVRPGEGLLPST